MPGLLEWNEKNREFADSDVGKTLARRGCVWIIQETAKDGWKARVLNPERVDLQELQTKTWVKLEPANEQH